MDNLKIFYFGFVLILIFSFRSCQSIENKSEITDRPNILWIVLEDMSPQFIGAYGNKAAKTPVIDSLINSGIKFNSAFSTGSVCSPSRYTIITGTRTYEYGTGHHRSNYPIPDFVQPFPKFLKEIGYHTSNNSKRDYNTSARWKITKAAWTESSPKAGWWNRKDQPFFSVFNFDNCHQSRTFTNPYEDYKERILDKLSEDEIVRDEDIALPNYYEDTPELRKELARTYNAMKKTDNEINILIKRLRNDGLIESTIIFLYSDHGGGALRTKSKGIALGHQVPMAVIIPKKFEHLNPFKGKSSTDQPVTFEDLGPTVLALAGLDQEQYMTGKPFLGKNHLQHKVIYCSSDRCGEADNLTRSIANERYFYTRVFTPGKSQMNLQKYFDYSKTRQLTRKYYDKKSIKKTQSIPFEIRPTELLYDLKKDNWQTNNLAKNPEYKDILITFRDSLDSELTKSKDIHFIPEYALDSISQTITPYEFRISVDYDFKTIYKIAKLANEEPNTILAQIKALQNQDPFVRYWAAIGLSKYKKEELKVHSNVLHRTLKEDTFYPVKILIASSLYSKFNSEIGKKLLQRLLYHPNIYLRTQTIQEIIYFEKDKALSFLHDILKIQTEIELNKTQSNFTESVDMYLYLFTGKPLRYETHW